MGIIGLIIKVGCYLGFYYLCWFLCKDSVFDVYIFLEKMLFLVCFCCCWMYVD